MGSKYMDNIKNDQYYLEKIKNDLRFVIKHTSGKTKEQMENDEILLDSIMFRIIQISENIGKLTNLLKKEHSDVSWVAIKVCAIKSSTIMATLI